MTRTGVTMHWAIHAACKGMPTEWFYGWGTGRRWRGRPPSKTRPDVVHPEVKAACARCPVRRECLDHALTHWEQGWWGGHSEEQRHAMQPEGAEQRRLEAHMSRFDWPANEEARRSREYRQRRDDNGRNT